MAEKTKAVNLTEGEIKILLSTIGHNVYGDNKDIDSAMERLGYLHKRLKAFNEAPENAPAEATQAAPQTANLNSGWPSNG